MGAAVEALGVAEQLEPAVAMRPYDARGPASPVTLRKSRAQWFVASATTANYAEYFARVTVAQWEMPDTARTVCPGIRRLVEHAVRRMEAGALLDVRLELQGDQRGPSEFIARVGFLAGEPDVAGPLGAGLRWARYESGAPVMWLAIRFPPDGADAATNQLWP